MLVGYGELNQVMIPKVSAFANEVSFLEHICTILGTHYAALNLVNTFSLTYRSKGVLPWWLRG